MIMAQHLSEVVIVIDESVIVTYWLRKIVSVVVIEKGHRWVTLICLQFKFRVSISTNRN